MVLYSVRYWTPLLDDGVWTPRLIGATPLTFSASPSSPAARYRYFITSFPIPAEVAAADADEAAAVAAVAAVLRVASISGTWTGMVYEMNEWIEAYVDPTRNWMICMVVRLRLRLCGIGTENAVKV